MKKFKLFTLALAAVSMAACSNDEDVESAVSAGTKGAPIEVSFAVEGHSVNTKGNSEGLVGDNATTIQNPWAQGDKLRFFITDYESAKNNNFIKYEGAIALNRELSYNATLKGWEYSDGADPATLSNVKARLYAYSPSQTTQGSAYYNGDNALKPNACPIEFNTPNKVDFLYGTHRNTLDGSANVPGDNPNDNGGSTHPEGTSLDYIDNKNNKTRLYMKHAQAYVEVRLLKSTDPKKKYSGEGRVTCVEIMGVEQFKNAQGKDDFQPTANPNLPSKGTCDATAEGEITVTETAVLPMTDFYKNGGKCEFLLNPDGPGSPDFGDGQGFALVCPAKGDVLRGFHLTVDGKDFYISANDVKFNDQRTVMSNKPVEWKAGFKYIYTFTLTGKGIELIPDPINPPGDGDVDGDGIADFIVVKPWNPGADLSQDF